VRRTWSRAEADVADDDSSKPSDPGRGAQRERPADATVVGSAAPPAAPRPARETDDEEAAEAREPDESAARAPGPGREDQTVVGTAPPPVPPPAAPRPAAPASADAPATRGAAPPRRERTVVLDAGPRAGSAAGAGGTPRPMPPAHTPRPAPPGTRSRPLPVEPPSTDPSALLEDPGTPPLRLTRLAPPGHAGEVIPLDPARFDYQIGRHEACEIRLYSPSASRRHARLVKRGETWFLRPGAGKTVRVGRREAGSEVELKDGQHLRLGEDELRVDGAGSPAHAARRDWTKIGLAAAVVLLAAALAFTLLAR
jgi:hypothetical protein